MLGRIKLFCVREGMKEEEVVREKPETKNDQPRDFPGGLGAKTPYFQLRGPGFHPWSGNWSHMLHLRVHNLHLQGAQPNKEWPAHTDPVRRTRERKPLDRRLMAVVCFPLCGMKPLRSPQNIHYCGPSHCTRILSEGKKRFWTCFRVDVEENTGWKPII